ncbi:MAG: hypothetical protein PHY72_02815 [Candidatus Pacebacteria bacterium]|nr:hypothetical protein [Candidatus Paceibacterota bacterium]
MVNDILKSIEEKAESQIQEILKKNKEDVLVLEKEYNLAVGKKQEEQKEMALRKAAKEIEEFEKNLQTELNFKMQEEKNKLIKDIYRKAQEKVSSLNDAEFKKLIKHMALFLPKDKKGHIKAGERTAKALEGIVDKEVKVENALKEEGFMFVSHDIEIDLRISQLIFQLQETANPELIKMLFA